MQEFFDIIKRDDIYNIAVPIGIVALGWLFTFLSNRLNNEKQWKQAVEKSIRDKYFAYFLVTIVIGIFFIVAFVFLIWVIEVLTNLKVGLMFVKVMYALMCALIYGYLIFCRQNKKFAESKCFNIVLLKIPFIISAVMWSFIFTEHANLILRGSFIAMAVYEIFFLIVLDGNRAFKYMYVTFYLYSGKTIEMIATGNIEQKGGWVIAQSESAREEYRFRIKDVEKVEYLGKGNSCVH